MHGLGGHDAEVAQRHVRRVRSGADAGVVSVQNGSANEEFIAEVAPRVMRGTIVTAGAITAPGTVHYDAHGYSGRSRGSVRLAVGGWVYRGSTHEPGAS